MWFIYLNLNHEYVYLFQLLKSDKYSKMGKYFNIIIVIIGFFNQIKAQSLPSKIHCKTVTEFNVLFGNKPKKILFKVYSKDCHTCYDMDEKILSDKNIVNYINKTFYAIKLDAFDKSPINLRGHIYETKDGLNPLASFLLKGNIKFPSLIFIDDKLTMIDYSEGYNSLEMINMTLHYLGDNAYKIISWQAFQKNFKTYKM